MSEHPESSWNEYPPVGPRRTEDVIARRHVVVMDQVEHAGNDALPSRSFIGLLLRTIGLGVAIVVALMMFVNGIL
jgi:hypothetical protein